MSNEKQETTADIIAEMRHGLDKSWHEIDREWARSLPDRIEAAILRERLLSKPPENDDSAPVVSTGDNSCNGAAMREALEAARDLLLPQCNGGTAFAKACGEIVNKIMDALKTSDGNAAAMRGALMEIRDICLRVGANISPTSKKYQSRECETIFTCFRKAADALSAPPRNCDVGTLQEQEARYHVTGRLYHTSTLQNVLSWAQMPYEEKEGASK